MAEVRFTFSYCGFVQTISSEVIMDIPFCALCLAQMETPVGKLSGLGCVWQDERGASVCYFKSHKSTYFFLSFLHLPPVTQWEKKSFKVTKLREYSFSSCSFALKTHRSKQGKERVGLAFLVSNLCQAPNRSLATMQNMCRSFVVVFCTSFLPEHSVPIPAYSPHPLPSGGITAPGPAFLRPECGA